MQRRLSPDPCRPPQHLTPSLVREANSPSQSTMANIHEAFIYTGAVCSRCFPRTPSLKGSQQHREKQHYPVLTLQTGDKGPQGIRDVSKATPLLNGRDVLEVWGQSFHKDENNKQNCFLNDFLTTDKPMQQSPDAKH